jgi:hypothetical protein
MQQHLLAAFQPGIVPYNASAAAHVQLQADCQSSGPATGHANPPTGHDLVPLDMPGHAAGHLGDHSDLW